MEQAVKKTVAEDLAARVCCRCPEHSTRTEIDPDCDCLGIPVDEPPYVSCPPEHAESCHCPVERQGVGQ